MPNSSWCFRCAKVGCGSFSRGSDGESLLLNMTVLGWWNMKKVVVLFDNSVLGKNYCSSHNTPISSTKRECLYNKKKKKFMTCVFISCTFCYLYHHWSHSFTHIMMLCTIVQGQGIYSRVSIELKAFRLQPLKELSKHPLFLATQTLVFCYNNRKWIIAGKEEVAGAISGLYLLVGVSDSVKNGEATGAKPHPKWTCNQIIWNSIGNTQRDSNTEDNKVPEICLCLSAQTF